jgi:predicted MFS family arabinose efflux permease
MGLGWLLIGYSPVFVAVLLGIGTVGAAGSLWHLPSQAFVSSLFPKHRSTALSFQSFGANIGDSLGPIVTGALLGFLTWRGVLSIYAVPPLFLTILIFLAFRNIGKIGGGTSEAITKTALKEQAQVTFRLFKDPVIWGINVVTMLRHMGAIAFITFLPLYLSDTLHFSSQKVGIYMSLLVTTGMFGGPIRGFLADRIGRKQVLVPSGIAMAGMMLLLVQFGEGALLPLLFVLIGFLHYGEQPILNATVLDLVSQRSAATTLGLMSFLRLPVSALGPIVGGAIYGTVGIDGTLYYVGAVMLLAVSILAFVPLKRRAQQA